MSLHELDNGQGSGLPAPTSYGVWGDSNTGDGVIGTSQGATGVYGQSNLAGYDTSDEPIPGGIGVSGVNNLRLGTGVSGQSDAGVGVSGTSADGTGVSGLSITGAGVTGSSFGSTGVSGASNSGYGVTGYSGNIGVGAFNSTNNHAAYLASDCCAAWFTGDVVVAGTLTKTHNKFQIDHPLDPDNKFLFHSAVESSEMKNVYDGVVVLDANGQAVVEFPTWFAPLNTDFRYQLTCIGGYAPVYIAQEIQGNRFTIAGGTPSLKVSWQVTGIRQDAWAKAHPMRVEEDKSDEERGHYMHPELHGAPEEKSIGHARHRQQTPPMP